MTNHETATQTPITVGTRLAGIAGTQPAITAPAQPDNQSPKPTLDAEATISYSYILELVGDSHHGGGLRHNHC